MMKTKTMKFEERARRFFDNYGVYIFMFTVAAILISFLVYAFVAPHLAEGMVMNKWISPAYKTCDEDGHCSYRSTKYVIAVQDGDTKDWWYVTENYYDSVKIGDWVTK